MIAAEPILPHLDARVGFFPRRGLPQGIYGVVKVTYDVSGPPTQIDAVPLTTDVLHPNNEPKLELGCDFWLDKRFTDVVILGSAHASAPTSETQISAAVGDIERRVAVVGRRVAHRRGERLIFAAPVPFTEMPVTWDRAFGGIDARVPLTDRPADDPLATLHDHPGLYPRNPFGKGYVVIEPRRDEEIELPNLEDPDDRLTPERLIVGDPRRWWVQPIPATFHYAPHGVFTRYVYLGGDAWFSPPDDERLAEVRSGILPAAFRELFPPGIDAGFYQEAAPGLVLAEPPSDTPILVRGMHPEGKVVRARLPAPPEIEIDLDGRRQIGAARLSKIVVIPAQQKLVLTWVTTTREMHRTFVPGVHAKIPLRMRIGAKDWIAYRTPKPLRQIAAEAEESGLDLTPPKPRRPRDRRDRED
jgi:hypothetical protein